MKKNGHIAALLSCFWVAGTMDLVALATNGFQQDLGLSGTQAGIIPWLMYLWFLLIPPLAGALMGRAGRRNTVCLALAIIACGLAVATFPGTASSAGSGWWRLVAAVILLGIGNTVLIVSLNPLVASLLPGGKLAAGLTAGQSAKALSGLLAPVVAAWGIRHLPALGWHIVFPVYLLFALLAAILLLRCVSNSTGRETSTRSSSGPEATATAGAAPQTSLRALAALFRNRVVRMSFFAVLCHVGSDIAIGIVLPQLFAARLGWSAAAAAQAITLYFGSRLAGSLAGIWLLQRRSRGRALLGSVILLLSGLALAFIGSVPVAGNIVTAILCAAVVLLGLGNANICSLIISEALLEIPQEQDNASVLMTMGLAGGAIFPPLTLAATDALGLPGALAVILLCAAFLLLYVFLLLPLSRRNVR